MEFDIITCEYPPNIGGVAEYTELLAHSLASRGVAVRILVPGSAAYSTQNGGITVMSLPRGFSLRGLLELHRTIGPPKEGRRVLVQYVPTGYGWFGMNVGLCIWIYLRRAVGIEIMFHEVMLPFSNRLKANIGATVNRLMAFLIARGARRIYISTLAWMPSVRRFAGPRKRIDLLPIPSSVPHERAGKQGETPYKPGVPGSPRIGHFGAQSYHGPLLPAVISRLAASGTEWQLVLIGKGSLEFLSGLVATSPHLSKRVLATGELPSSHVAAHLSQCDLSLQPYADGITTRRTSAMASLCLGIPVVTNVGPLTENAWKEEPIVFIASAPHAGQIAAQVLSALDDDERRREIGAAGRSYYQNHFAIERTLEILLA